MRTALPGGGWSVWRDKALPDPGDCFFAPYCVICKGVGSWEGEGGWEGEVGGGVDCRKGGSGREKENDEEEGRIWKLMKRFSTGGLRDKYHCQIGHLPRLCQLSLRNMGSGACVSQ